MNLTGTLGRALYALLVGIVVFIVVYIIGIVIASALSVEAGDLLKKFAPLLGLLAGLVHFFLGSRGPNV